MATKTEDIQLRLSGGLTNANPLNSLGGIMSNNIVTPALYDSTSATEATNGRTEHRLVYALNARNSTLRTCKAYIKANTPHLFTTVEVGLASIGRNGTEPAIATEGAVPQGIQFTAAENLNDALTLGDIPTNQRYGIWIRWQVSPNCPAINPDSFTLQVFGDYEE